MAEDRIGEMIHNFTQSRLDEAVRAVCPFYNPLNREFTGAYLDFHEYAKVGTLARMQVKLKELEILAEEETENGRVDGSVQGIGLENSDVFLYDNEGKSAEKIALVEAKTEGSVKILQSAAYTSQSKIPDNVGRSSQGHPQ